MIKGSLEEYFQLLVEEVHFIKVKYTGEPLNTID
jgi:hypothetical protein